MRALKEEEIEKLKRQGNRCEDWGKIRVDDGFTTERIYNSHFRGEICIGKNVEIDNVGLIEMTCKSSFGVGEKATVLNENGSRVVTLVRNMTAQTAYLESLWLNDKEVSEAYDKLTKEEEKRAENDVMRIGDNVTIRNCTEIRNVEIEECAELTGVKLAENGIIGREAKIGYGVIARNFITDRDAEVGDDAQINRVYVGQNVTISEQFAATDSVFFGNSQMMHGEATALMAGPFSVSHHKSTLLIASSVSMFNAGSGSNQSNHMYKSGPIHYGITGRGTKLGSDSYMMWPSIIGVFTTVLGKHKTKLNVDDFPFSYLIGEGINSRVMPGMTLGCLGTYRDAKKWKDRDARREEDKHDIINFDLLNAYTASKVRKGLKRMMKFVDEGEEWIEVEPHVAISRTKAEKGYEMYRMAMEIYAGKYATVGRGKDEEWVDLNGQVAKRSDVEMVMDKLRCGKIKSVENLREELARIEKDYARNNAEYATTIGCELLGKSELKTEDIEELKRMATKAKETIIKLVVKDARKEFEGAFSWNYGIDQKQEAKESDIVLHRGELDEEKVRQLITDVL